MASAPYPLTMKQILDKDIDFLVDDVKPIYYEGAFSALHHFISDLNASEINATGANLSNKTTTAGVFDADNQTDTLTAGTVVAVIIAVDLGADAVSPLVCYLEFSPPVVSVGGSYTMTWNAGGIFQLAAC